MKIQVIISFLMSFFLVPAAVIADSSGAKLKATEKPGSYYEEDFSIKLSGEPGRLLAQAQKDMKENKRDAAAADIEKASALVKQEAGKTDGIFKTSLMDSASELDRLSNQVKSGEVKFMKDVNGPFGKANYYLSKSYLDKSSKDWTDKRIKEAGKDLDAAMVNFEDSFKMLNERMSKGEKDLMVNINSISAKLMKDSGWITNDVDKGFADFNSAMSRLNSKIAMLEKASK
jgi:hypothetical protein